MNILIYLCILILSMASIFLAYKYLGKLGLIVTYITMNIVSFILTFKYITLTTINANSNCIAYITMLTALYLHLETTNKKETSKLANLNFITNIFMAIMLYIMTCYTQSLTDTISINMKNVFLNNSNILLVYPLTTLISSYLLILVYDMMKKLYDNHFITTVTIYLLVGIIEGIIYTLLAYGTILPIKTIIMIILSTYMVRLITTVIYSLYLTLLAKKKVIS
ncbi:MAG: VUT family protein [Clostridia bacterium]|nr:VUT family protein [Clostridia bacterium]